MIDIGQNDLADSFAKNLSYAQVIKRIPSITAQIESAIKVSAKRPKSRKCHRSFLTCHQIHGIIIIYGSS